ncbi:hypothetical protein AYO40_04540, partial [Planctomycetaceae bacterium SCGC AG-212-D15]
DQEFEQIHQLNYRTFVSEIPQHDDPGDGRLVDKFHAKNAYFIVLVEGRVVGMVCGHDQPPFSVADRLTDPGILTRPGTRPLEVRLLAIEPDRRNSTVFFGLMWALYNYAMEQGYTHLFISGIEERLPLYRRLGLEPLGPAVGHGKASFVPMVLTVGRLPERVLRTKLQWESHMTKVPAAEPVCLLPGPVAISAAVRDAFHQPPVYHRGPEFIERFAQVRRTLGDLVGGRQVALLNGSGTLGNEAVAALLAADKQCREGVMLVNGEFGERLARQALRFGLRPRVLNWPWGRPWDLKEVEGALAALPAGSWVWGVHQESSTGVLNDLPGLVRAARKFGARVCLDCISSLGAVPLDLEGVYLATGASGKSLGAFAGVAMVFADGAALTRVDLERVPSYFDIPAALASRGPRYTFPSPTLAALETALEEYATPERAQAKYARYAELGQLARRRLRALGVEPLAADMCASPVVTTFATPGKESSEEFVARCASWGYAIGGQSGYLADRRLVQIATMGAIRREELAGFLDQLERWLMPGERAARKARQPVASV